MPALPVMYFALSTAVILAWNKLLGPAAAPENSKN